MENCERPVSVKLICFFNLLIIIFAFITVLVDLTHKRLLTQSGPAYVISFFLGIISLLVANVGYWKMKKWGIYTYATIVIISFFMTYFMSLTASAMICLLPQLISLAVGLKNYRLFH